LSLLQISGSTDHNVNDITAYYRFYSYTLKPQNNKKLF